MQGLADGYFILPYTIGNYLSKTELSLDSNHLNYKEAKENCFNNINKLLSIRGTGCVMDGVSRMSKLQGISEPHARRSAALDRWSWNEIERAAGGPTLRGNDIRLHFEGSSTFDVWLEAIQGAKQFVYFENYLLRDGTFLQSEV